MAFKCTNQSQLLLMVYCSLLRKCAVADLSETLKVELRSITFAILLPAGRVCVPLLHSCCTSC
eukprot:2395194-Amphidinium_carterae.2